MSKDWYQDLVEFHRAMGDNFPKKPHLETTKYRELRKSLIHEEVQELLIALDKGDLVAIADGIVDSIVVLLGSAITYGIDIRPIWDEVHKTNMAKLGGPIRHDGKFLKPEGWKPPQIKEILIKQGMEG